MSALHRLRLRARQVGSALALLALAASAVYAGDPFGLRARLLGLPEPKPPASGRVAVEAASDAEASDGTLLRSQPWWQDVETFEGTGPGASSPFTIDEAALQWRVRWTCSSGELVVRAATHEEPLVDAPCPEGEAGYSTRTGRTRLEVDADGPWELEVQQQVDVPLDEPPLPAMTAPGTVRVASGSFYDIDQKGTGEVTIYRTGEEAYALRLEEFFVTPNVDLEIRLSPLEAPRTTDEYLTAPAVLVDGLDVTAGSMNFPVPERIDPTEYRSVVIWCPPLRSAYAAASLEGAR